MMKKITLALLTIVALAGCGKSSDEKAADTMNSDMDQAVSLYNSASEDYNKAVTLHSLVGVVKLSEEDLNTIYVKYKSARDKYNEASKKLQRVLDMDDDHKNVKLVGRDSVKDALAKSQKRAALAQKQIDKFDDYKNKIKSESRGERRFD